MQGHLYRNNRVENDIQTQQTQSNVIEVNPEKLLFTAETICNQCRYPFLGLRLLIHIICGLDAEGKIQISARQLSKKLGVHYDTVTKCLKFLRNIHAIQSPRDRVY